MTKQKNLGIAFFALLMIMPALFIFTACGSGGGPRVSALQVTFTSEVGAEVLGNTTYVTKDYGNISGLKDFQLEASYTNGTTEILKSKEKCQSVLFTPVNSTPQQLTYDTFYSKLTDGTLDAGFWQIDFAHDGVTASLQITINTIASSEPYILEINNEVSTLSAPANTLYYGLKEEAYSLKVTRNSTEINSEYFESMLYFLSSSAVYDEQKTAEEYYAENKLVQSYIEGLKPNDYYVCAKVYANGNYNEAFTKLTKLTIKKSVFEIDATGMTFNYSFNYSEKIADITIDDMGVTGGALIICSDGDSTNNADTNDSKKTNEDVTDVFDYYGNFVPVDSVEVYNFADNGKQIAVTFEPNVDFADYFEKSAVFYVTLSIEQGEVSLPYIGNQFGNMSGETVENNIVGTYRIELDLRYNTNDTMYFDIDTNANRNINQDTYEQTNSFYTQTAGNFYAKFTLKNQNYKWASTTANLNNSACTCEVKEATGEQNAYANFEWTIEKSTPMQVYWNLFQNADYGNDVVVAFNENGTVNIRLGGITDNILFNGLDITWTVAEENIQIGGDASYTTTVTGTLSDYASKEGDSRYKTLTITSTIADPSMPIRVGFRIQSTGNVNFNAFDELYLVSINKIVYYREVMQIYTIDTNEYGYIVFKSGDTLQTILDNLPTTYGEWKLYDENDNEITSPNEVTATTGTKLKLTFTPNTYYYDYAYLEVYLFDHEPTNSDFITE